MCALEYLKWWWMKFLTGSILNSYICICCVLISWSWDYFSCSNCSPLASENPSRWLLFLWMLYSIQGICREIAFSCFFLSLCKLPNYHLYFLFLLVFLLTHFENKSKCVYILVFHLLFYTKVNILFTLTCTLLFSY